MSLSLVDFCGFSVFGPRSAEANEQVETLLALELTALEAQAKVRAGAFGEPGQLGRAGEKKMEKAWFGGFGDGRLLGNRVRTWCFVCMYWS